jgi:hypothetical protein
MQCVPLSVDDTNLIITEYMEQHECISRNENPAKLRDKFGGGIEW